MVNSHNKSFFGTSVGMILDSTSMTDQNLFLTFIRKKQDSSWERPSNNEGKKISFNLEEIVWILEVLSHREPEWSTVHKFGEITSKISIYWIKDEKEKERFCIQVNGYKKQFNFAETTLLMKLLEHILEEKIEHATIPTQRTRPNEKLISESEILEEKAMETSEMPVVVEEVISPDIKRQDTQTVQGVMQGETEKALKIMFENGMQLWVPKSTIHTPYNSTLEKLQKFIIDTWILKKNNIID